MGELLKILDASVPDHRKGRRWPNSPQALTSRIRRVAPSLRRDGIDAAPIGRSESKRTWRVTKTRTPPGGSSGSSGVVSPVGKSGFAADDLIRVGSGPLYDGESHRLTNPDEETARQAGVVRGEPPSEADGPDEDDVRLSLSLEREEGEAGWPTSDEGGDL